jgi:hypothetical protein
MEQLTLNLQIMKKNLLLPFIIATLLLSTLKCAAQLSLELKTIKINNINVSTNHKTDPRLIKIGIVVSGISLYVTTELTNTSDSVLYFSEEEGVNRDNIRLALSFYEIGSGWKKMYLYNPQSSNFNVFPEIDSLNPGESITMQAGVEFPNTLFVYTYPLYYISGIVPSMYLALEIPGQESIFSDFTKNVYVNGRNTDQVRKECYNCLEIYIATINFDAMVELMGWAGSRGSLSALFSGVFFNNSLVDKAFVCNMDFARRELSILRQP